MKKKAYSLRHRKWRCPECNARLQVWVRLSAIPTCHNPQQHERRIVQMVPNRGDA